MGARYRNSQNKCINRCTGIIDLLGFNKPMLMNWALSNGDDAKKISKKALGIGTYCHQILESYIYGTDIDPEKKKEATCEMIVVANRGLEAFKKWEDTNSPEYLESEYMVVSEKDNWGGCADLIVMIDGKKYLCDFKTSKGVYREHLIQLSAYRNAVLEMSSYSKSTIIDLQKNNKVHNMLINDYRDLAEGAYVFHIQKDIKNPFETKIFTPYFIPQPELDEAKKDGDIAIQLNTRRTTFNKFLKELER